MKPLRFFFAALLVIGACVASDLTSPESEVVVSNLRRWGWEMTPFGTGGGPPGCDPESQIAVNDHGAIAPSPAILFDCEEQGGYQPCGPGKEEVDIMRQEYMEYNMLPMPSCGDFQTDGGSQHFDWEELNDGWSSDNPHPPWGIITGFLTGALETTRTNYNRGAIRISSGYRCAKGNYLAGGVSGSRHIRGMAADMFSVSYSWTETEYNLLRTAASDAGMSVPFNYYYYGDHHLHGHV